MAFNETGAPRERGVETEGKGLSKEPWGSPALRGGRIGERIQNDQRNHRKARGVEECPGNPEKSI